MHRRPLESILRERAQEEYLETLLRFQDWCMDRGLPWKREVQKCLLTRIGEMSSLSEASALCEASPGVPKRTRHFSAEHRQKISEACRAAWARKKQSL